MHGVILMMHHSSNAESSKLSAGDPSTTGTWELSLGVRWRGRLLILIVTVAACFILLETIKAAYSAAAANSTYVNQVRQALAFDPNNPALLDRLGLLYSLLPNDFNMGEALKNFRRAVTLNPNEASYWTNLASTCKYMGDLNCADQAIERAQALQPKLSDMQWIVGNYYMQTDRVDEALPYFRELLQIDPDTYAGPTFRMCLRALGDPNEVYNRVVTPQGDSQLKLSYISFLSETGNLESAFQTWRRVVKGGLPVPALDSVDPLLDNLIKVGRIQEAGEVWADLGHMGVVPRPSSQGDNLVYNAGFEHQPLNTGFDWLYSQVPFVNVDFADPSAYRGSKSLRVDFTFPRNEDVAIAYHIVPVSPGQTYLLTAFARSDGITSDSGPVLRIAEVGCPQCAKPTTETTVGTTNWHPLSLQFTTAAQTQGVVVELWRARSRTYPPNITGTFWLDDVEMKAVDASAQNAALNRTQ